MRQICAPPSRPCPSARGMSHVAGYPLSAAAARFVDICTVGGMEAVGRDPHYENLFERNPANKQRLLSTDAVRTGRCPRPPRCPLLCRLRLQCLGVRGYCAQLHALRGPTAKSSAAQVGWAVHHKHSSVIDIFSASGNIHVADAKLGGFPAARRRPAEVPSDRPRRAHAPTRQRPPSPARRLASAQRRVGQTEPQRRPADRTDNGWTCRRRICCGASTRRRWCALSATRRTTTTGCTPPTPAVCAGAPTPASKGLISSPHSRLASPAKAEQQLGDGAALRCACLR